MVVLFVPLFPMLFHLPDPFWMLGGKADTVGRRVLVDLHRQVAGMPAAGLPLGVVMNDSH